MAKTFEISGETEAALEEMGKKISRPISEVVSNAFSTYRFLLEKDKEYDIVLVKKGRKGYGGAQKLLLRK